jgi:hypothetical protein
MLGNVDQTYIFQSPAASPSSVPISVDQPVLKLMKAAMTYIQILGCESLIWDPDSRWTLSPAHVMLLPDNMKPTEAQLTIPHHPIFDLLPWASLRTRMIYIFSLPPEQRPQNARDPMAVVNLTYDIEDDTEGFRVNGDGMLSDEWEVGGAFFRNWWWALDRQIVNTTNTWRMKRGENRLMLKAS